jgi:putative SOS response-associated peptidase YedK
MPVILEGEARSRWLDPAAGRSHLEALLVPRPADGMDAVIVAAQYVNYGVDDERCLEPVAPGEEVQAKSSFDLF